MLSQQPGGGSRDPTLSELPSTWVGMCNSQANQTSKTRGEEGMVLFLEKRKKKKKDPPC